MYGRRAYAKSTTLTAHVNAPLSDAISLWQAIGISRWNLRYTSSPKGSCWKLAAGRSNLMMHSLLSGSPEKQESTRSWETPYQYRRR